MSDSPDAAERPARRTDPSREPPTLDLKATVLEEDAPAPAQPTEGEPYEEAAGASPAMEEAGPPPAREPPPSLEPAPGRSRVGPTLAAGLLGGLAGAGLVLAVEAWRVPEGRLDERLAPWEQRLAQWEQQLDALPRQENVEALQARIAALESAQPAVNQRLAAAQTLAERASSLAQDALNRAAAGSATTAAPSNAAEVDALANRLAGLEAQLGERAQVDELANRLAGLEAQLRDRAQAVGTANEAVEARLAEQDRRIAALDKSLSAWNPDRIRAGLQVIVAGRSIEALREGLPLSDWLESLRQLNVEPGRLAALEPFADTGAPTVASLAQEFKPLGERIVSETRTSSGDWSDRLMHMASRIVTIRPLDQPGSTSVPALVARIDAALAQGALQDAVSAWEALPEPARRLSEGWADRLKKRAAAETAAREVSTEAIRALDTATR